MTRAGDDAERAAGFGCTAFGHLASPFVDGELSRSDQERFRTHLDACRPCQALVAEYRAIDVVARTPVAEPSAESWGAAWTRIRETIEADRAAAQGSPLGRVHAFALRVQGWRSAPLLRPLVAAAAAVGLVALLLAVQQSARHGAPPPIAEGRRPPEGVTAIATTPSLRGPTKVLSIACNSPDYMPVVVTTDGDDPLTVIQCALVDGGT